MANNEYIERLHQVIFHLRKADSTHVESVPVHEVFQWQTVWKGTVEVFTRRNHPKARRCYAWSHKSGKEDQDERFVAVLEIPPVDSALKAVQIQIVKDIREGKS